MEIFGFDLLGFGSSIWAWILSLPALLIFLAFYFLPTIIALLRRKRNSLAIFALNFLAGWTGIGWIVAIVWSLMSEDRGR